MERLTFAQTNDILMDLHLNINKKGYALSSALPNEYFLTIRHVFTAEKQFPCYYLSVSERAYFQSFAGPLRSLPAIGKYPAYKKGTKDEKVLFLVHTNPPAAAGIACHSAGTGNCSPQ